MPEGYDEAGERLRASLKASGKLHDGLEVTEEHRRLKESLNARFKPFTKCRDALFGAAAHAARAHLSEVVGGA